MLFCHILRDLLTADPDEIAPAPAEDERRAAEDEKRHDLSPEGSGAETPHQRQRSAEAPPRVTETTLRDRTRRRLLLSPADVLSPHSTPQGRHTTSRAPLYSAHSARHHARSTAPADSFGTFRRRYLSRARAPRRLAAYILH